MQHYGIQQTRDKSYGMAACLTYWVFKCRDRKKSPAMGTKTWTYLESSIRNSAEISTNLEDYLQRLCDKLCSQLRPVELTKIIQPTQRILRVNDDATEIKELPIDQNLVFMGWLDLLNDIAPQGFTEWDVLELLRTKAGIIQVLCRLRFEEDRALGMDEPEEFIEVEATSV
ncbi:MAG: hypothetical protein ACKPA7_19570 [Sphaerospermopsis kisseleviana]